MISDKAMLICLHITMWTARKHDKRVSEEVAQSHEANTNAGRYNKHLLDQAEKLKELRALAGQIRQYFYKVTLPWSDEGYRLLPSHLYFEFTNQMSEFKTAYGQLVREFLDAYPTYREQARNSLGLLYRDSDYPDWSQLTEKFDLTTDILPIPCGEDFRVTLGAEEKARVAREIDQQVKQSLTRATSELWSRLMHSVAHLAAQLERPKARLHTSTLRNVTEIADLVPLLNVTKDEELTALAQETNSRLASFTRQDLAQHPATRVRAAGIANELAAKIKHAMKDRGYDALDGSAAIGHLSGTAEAPAAEVVQMSDPKPSDPAPQPAPTPEVDQILARTQVILSPVLAEALKHWHGLTLYREPSDWLFPSIKEKGRIPRSASICSQSYLRPAAVKAGVIPEGYYAGRFGWHNMRHSLATFLSANDVHLSVTQSILRHKNMRTTADIYTHAVRAKQKEAQQKYLTAIGM